MRYDDVIFAKLVRLACLLTLAGAGVVGGAQSPVQASGDAAVPQRTPETLHSNTNLVALDVVVDDLHGKSLAGLNEKDFDVKEDGRPQKILYIEAHRASSPNRAEVAFAPSREPNTFNNYGDTGERSNPIILVMDDLDSPDLQAQLYLREQLIAYMRTVPRGTQIAMVQLDSSLHLLQGFTGDPDALLAAVKGPQDGPRLSPLPNTSCAPIGSSANGQGQQSSSNVIAERAIPICSPELQREFRHTYGQVAAETRAEILQRCLPELMNLVNSVPGRKSVVWFYSRTPAGEVYRHAANAAVTANEKALTDGLQNVTHAFEPTSISLIFVDTSTQFTLSAANEAVANFAQKHGGEAFANTNDIRQILEHVADNSWNYYTLYYSPTDRNFDGHYRQIAVELDQPHGLLQYQTGYFAEREIGPTEEGNGRRRLPKAPDPAEAAANEPFQKAMQLGNKAPQDVLFSVHIDPMQSGSGRKPPPNEKAFVSTRFKREQDRSYQLEYTLNARCIAFRQDGPGHFTGHAVLAAVVYDDAGDVASTIQTKITIRTDTVVLQQLMQQGAGVTQTVLVPAKSSRFLRVGVQDTTSGKAGALEVPLDEVAFTRAASR